MGRTARPTSPGPTCATRSAPASTCSSSTSRGAESAPRVAIRQISVFGAGVPTPHERELAAQVGRLLAAAGVTLVTGGLSGVMEAASRGAAEAGGTVLAILPGDDPHAANPHATV